MFVEAISLAHATFDEVPVHGAFEGTFGGGECDLKPSASIRLRQFQ